MSSRLSASVVILSSLVCACDFAIDDHVLRAPDAAADVDGGPADDGGSDADHFAESSPPDATPPESEDGGAPPPVVERPCAIDRDCGTSDICGPSAVCEAACSDGLGCAGPRVEHMGYAVLDDGARWLWVDQGSNDDWGQPGSDGAIYAWDRSSEPVVIASGLVRPQLVSTADGYVYFQAGQWVPEGVPVQRVSLQPGAAPERLDWHGRVLSVWSTSGYLWWVALDIDGAVLWRRARTEGASDERMRTLPEPLYTPGDTPTTDGPGLSLTGNDQYVFTQAAFTSPLYAAPVGGGEARVFPKGSETATLLPVGDRYLLVDLYGTTTRLDLENGTAYVVANRGEGWFSGGIAVLGGWLFVLQSAGGATADRHSFSIERVHVASRTTEHLVSLDLTYTTELGDVTFPPLFVAPDGTSVAYYHPAYKRLFTVAVPALPCSTELACPAGLQCGVDEQCK